MAPDGSFYSAVQKFADPDRLVVRARVKADLERLQRFIPDAKPFRKRWSDYPWRVDVAREDWALALMAMADEIEYTNYKSHVSKERGYQRSGIYGQVWSLLLDLEPVRQWRKRKREDDEHWAKMKADIEALKDEDDGDWGDYELWPGEDGQLEMVRKDDLDVEEARSDS
jgi:hypothetical protein